MTTRVWLMIIGSAAALNGLAASPSAAYERAKISPAIVPNFNQPDLSAANNAYKLSPEELKYDCKKLTGHMQIRIRQLRSTLADKPTSDLSHTLQKAVTPILGGTTRGTDPNGDNARDRSMLQALNGQLAAKKCQTFDLEALLAPGNTQDPRPIPKAKATAAPLVIKGAKPAPVVATPALPVPAAKAP